MQVPMQWQTRSTGPADPVSRRRSRMNSRRAAAMRFVVADPIPAYENTQQSRESSSRWRRIVFQTPGWLFHPWTSTTGGWGMSAGRLRTAGLGCMLSIRIIRPHVP